MKLTYDNMYIIENKDNTYSIAIELPDNSRNYVHSYNQSLELCLEYLSNLNELEIDIETVKIVPSGTYYRITFIIIVGENSDIDLQFHSRKLNLKDAISERRLLID